MGCLFSLITLPFKMIWEMIELFSGHHHHRSHRRRAPGCTRCGKRTPYKVCAACQKELEGLFSETYTLFQKALSLEVDSKKSEDRKEAHKTAKKVLKKMKKYASYGLQWNELPLSIKDYRLADSLSYIYTEYLRTTKKPPKNEDKRNNELEKLRKKYKRTSEKFKIIAAPELDLLLQNDGTNHINTDPQTPQNTEIPDDMANAIEQHVKSARDKRRKAETRLGAYQEAFNAIDELRKIVKPHEQEAMDSLEYTLLKEYRALTDSQSSKQEGDSTSV